MKPSLTKSVAMWFLPLSFFAYQFILRQWPSLTLQEIMSHYQVNAADFGLFSSVYYIGYAGLQIPVALLLNRYSPSGLIAAFASLAVGGMALLLWTDHWGLAILARFLMGAGSAMGFLGTSHIISLYFKPQHYGRMVALSFSCGLMGAIYGGGPVSLLLETQGTLATGKIIVGIGAVITLLIFVFLKTPSHSQENVSYSPANKEALTFLWKNKPLLILGISNLLLVGSLEGFADVWGTNFLTLAYDLNRTHAASIISFIFMGMLVGGPILAFLVERWEPFFVISLAGLGMAGLFVALLFGCAYMTPLTLKIVLFIVGIFCCYQVVVFTASQPLVPPEYHGISVAFLNAVNMLGGTFFHTLIGHSTNFMWDGTMVEGCPYYSSENLALSLSIIPLSALVGSFLVNTLKKK